MVRKHLQWVYAWYCYHSTDGTSTTAPCNPCGRRNPRPRDLSYEVRIPCKATIKEGLEALSHVIPSSVGGAGTILRNLHRGPFLLLVIL